MIGVTKQITRESLQPPQLFLKLSGMWGNHDLFYNIDFLYFRMWTIECILKRAVNLNCFLSSISVVLGIRWTGIRKWVWFDCCEHAHIDVKFVFFPWHFFSSFSLSAKKLFENVWNSWNRCVFMLIGLCCLRFSIKCANMLLVFVSLNHTWTNKTNKHEDK